MKPNKHNRILRIIAVLLAVIIGTASVAGGMATIICYRTDMYSNMTQQDILKQMNRQIQEHYEMTVIDNLDNSDFDQLKNTNLTYQVFNKDPYASADEDSDMPATPYSGEGYTYSTGDELIHYEGVIANLLFRNNIYIGGNDTEDVTIDVESIIFNPMNNVFYYKTGNGDYYPVNTISLDARWGQILPDENGSNTSTLVYHLKKETNAYVCMSTNYAPLDTKKYSSWTIASLDGTKIYTPCIEEESFDPVSNNRKAEFYRYTVDRNLDTNLDDDQLYVVTNKSFSESVRTPKGNYELLQSAPKIHVEKKIESFVIYSSVASPLDMTKEDLFVQCTKVINTLYPYHSIILTGTLIGILLFVLLVILSCRYTLYLVPEKDGDEDKPGMFARIPLLVFLALTGSLLAICFITLNAILGEWIYTFNSVINSQAALLLVIVMIILIICMTIILNICERIRTKTLFQSTICYHVGLRFQKPLRWLQDTLRHYIKWAKDFIIEHTSLFIRALIIWIAISVLEIIAIELTNYNTKAEFGLFTIYKVLEAIFIFFCVGQFNHIAKGSAQRAKGNLSEKLDTKRLFGPFKRHAENLNKINDGVQIAMQERLKSEHFKTELITNVTHDIKTPLTSIINYVDLLKQEGLTPTEHSQYLDVLDRQSARLKKLIEDLIDASKASTGNLTVNLETCNLNILLTQTLGEFEEKLLKNHLELIIRNSTTNLKMNDQPIGTNAGHTAENTEIVIQADSRHLWRIFDNLMTNICKYAQPNTRVYIDLEADATEARIIFRNTSRYQLEGDGEALLERFVRGDSSRNTEGNGLGLSIAKNLAELMKGHLSLSVDGDLFKVIITFPLYIKRPEE